MDCKTRVGIALSLSIIGLALGGCTASKFYALRDSTYEPFKPSNAYEHCFMPENVVRVAILPINSNVVQADLAEHMDSTLRTELTRKNLFEVVSVSRDDLMHDFGIDQFDSTLPLPPEFFVKLYERTGANALIFTDLTDYKPYKPISLGLRAKMIDVNTGKTLWAFDNVFDSGNPHVAVAARNFEVRFSKKGYPLELEGAILRSPNLFMKYVAFDAFETIPPREY